MNTSNNLVHPNTFEDGREYLLVERDNNVRQPAYIPVRFVDYDSCTAFIIVCTERGSKRRCLRDDIFMKI